MAKQTLQKVEAGDGPNEALTTLQQMTTAANNNFGELYTGYTGTLTFGGGGSGDVATLTLTDGRVTGVTTVP